MTFTNGKHPYNGKFNDRFKRFRSKLGMTKKKCVELGEEFKQIEIEKKQNEKKNNDCGNKRIHRNCTEDSSA